MLFMFTEPSSPKIRDLRRDGRYALHGSVDRKDGEPLIEFLVSGAAQSLSDKLIRAGIHRPSPRAGGSSPWMASRKR